MGELAPDSTEFRETLDQLVQAHWNDRGTPMLLAQVPQRLKQAGVVYDKSILHPSESLRAFIERTTFDVLRVVSDRNNPVIVGLVPASVDQSLVLPDSWFQRSSEQSTSSPRFLKSIFSAFSKPLTASRRTISVSEKRFFELQDGDPDPPGSIPVSSELIRRPGEDVSDDELARRVRVWAEENSVPIGTILQDEGEKRSKSLGRKEALILDSLTNADLQRIMIPLDIVLKLLR